MVQLRRVDYESYLKKTLRMLQEFGYPSLTLDEVRTQAERILVGEDVGANVIGVMPRSPPPPPTGEGDVQ